MVCRPFRGSPHLGAAFGRVAMGTGDLLIGDDPPFLATFRGHSGFGLTSGEGLRFLEHQTLRIQAANTATPPRKPFVRLLGSEAKLS